MANKFEWKEEYNLGINKIDEQHQNFFIIANKASELADKPDASREELVTIIGELLNYSLYHLSTEEELFYSLSYPDKEPHIEAHNAFRIKSGQFIGQTAEEETSMNDLASDVSNFVINWLTGHILVVDKKYASFFKEHGIE